MSLTIWGRRASKTFAEFVSYTFAYLAAGIQAVLVLS